MPSFISLTAFLLVAGQLIPNSVGYIWPSRELDEVEALYTIAGGMGRSPFADGVAGCTFPPGNQRSTGRQNSAEWLRLAYHDMATHDASQGTGGLDASIQFELDRPQNVGDGMSATLGFFLNVYSAHVSMADATALGIIYAVNMCTGPSIPFKAGRIDATEAGPATVPEPQEDLATHTASFARQGFNQSEMIALVACGHTIGGVHEKDFPEIVHEKISDTNTDGLDHFDTTTQEFDNRIATEWVDSTTTNPLAVGANQTTNSDARIFAADRNETMKHLASDNAVFLERCGDLLGRMIDTVPKEVTLSEVIEPLPVKPWIMQLSLTNEGKLHLGGYLRLFSKESQNSPDMIANITWTDRNLNTTSSYNSALTWSGLWSNSLWGSATMMELNVDIDASQGISSFVADWGFNSSVPATRADNGGGGFPVQDTIMFIKENSTVCWVSENQSTAHVIAAIRNDRPITFAMVSYTSAKKLDNSMVPQFPVANQTLELVGPSSSPLYTLYQATFDVSGTSGAYMDLIAVVGGETYMDQMKGLGFLAGSNC